MARTSDGIPCPSCGKPAAGNFCASCGEKLGGRFCTQCGAELSAGAAFCNQCGAGVPGGAARTPSSGATRKAGVPAGSRSGVENLPWWIAGAAMFALIVVIGVSMVRPGGPSTGAQATPSPAGQASGAAAVDLSSMTPREAADRLYNRVMTSVSEGDSTGAQAFLPMAIAAYERARPLDHDGLFHLSLLQRTAGELDAALSNALAVLDEDPNHILALSAAATAAAELGRTDEAGTFYRRLLDAYDEEVARGLPEYELHQFIMDSVRDTAEAFLEGR